MELGVNLYNHPRALSWIPSSLDVSSKEMFRVKSTHFEGALVILVLTEFVKRVDILRNAIGDIFLR